MYKWGRVKLKLYSHALVIKNMEFIIQLLIQSSALDLFRIKTQRLLNVVILNFNNYYYKLVNSVLS